MKLNRQLTMISGICLLLLLHSGCSGRRDAPQLNPISPVPSGNNYSTDLEKASEANTQLGIEFIRQGRYQVALDKLSKALQQNDDNAEAHSAMAFLYEKLKQYDGVEKHYHTALSLMPDNSSTHNNYGSFLCSRNRVEEAQAHFRKALSNNLYATKELVHTNIGLCALRSNRRNQAMDAFRQALQLNAKFPVALYQLADLHEQQGDAATAQRYYQRYTQVAQQTPQTLWLGVRIAHALGDKDNEANYALLLKSKYPDTEETRLLRLFEKSR